MFVFGHVGLTLGAASLLAKVLVKKPRQPSRANEPAEQLQASSEPITFPKSPQAGTGSLLESLASRIDLRILLIGSLLPDIIDKPIGRLFFGETFSNGRIFCHTLLFLIIITAGGLILYRMSSRTWLLVLSFGTFCHLILDGMWTDSHTLLWPLYGFSFVKSPVSIWSWMAGILHYLLANPQTLIPEIVGLVIVTWFVWQLARRKKLLAFIKYGQT